MSLWDEYKKYGGWDTIFGGGYQNPAKAGMPYFNQARGAIEQYLNPYREAGLNQLPGLQQQYGQLTSDPGGMMNKFGQSYQQSPGFKYALQQALQGAGHAQAAGGMAGSPQHEQQNMEIATQLANQDYNNWMQNALGMYGMGLQGQQGLYGTGAKAGIGMGEDLASIFGGQAKLAYEGQNAENQHNQGMLGSMLGGLGGVLGSFF